MNLLYCKLCEYACQLANGRQSMLGIFDNIRMPSFPVEHPPFFICIELEFEAHEADQEFAMRMVIIDEDGRSLIEFSPPPQTVPRDATGGPTRMQMTAGVGGIRFERPGMYRLDVLIDGEKMGEERISVLQV